MTHTFAMRTTISRRFFYMWCVLENYIFNLFSYTRKCSYLHLFNWLTCPHSYNSYIVYIDKEKKKTCLFLTNFIGLFILYLISLHGWLLLGEFLSRHGWFNWQQNQCVIYELCPFCCLINSPHQSLVFMHYNHTIMWNGNPVSIHSTWYIHYK